jgi:hypothetical protein
MIFTNPGTCPHKLDVHQLHCVEEIFGLEGIGLSDHRVRIDHNQGNSFSLPPPPQLRRRPSSVISMCVCDTPHTTHHTPHTTHLPTVGGLVLPRKAEAANHQLQCRLHTRKGGGGESARARERARENERERERERETSERASERASERERERERERRFGHLVNVCTLRDHRASWL